MLLALAALLGTMSMKLAEPILEKLGIDSANAQNYIMANFTGSFSADYDVQDDYISTPRLKALAGIVQGDKTGAAREFCAYIKKYVNSEEFMARYQEKRANSKPGYEPDRPDAAMLDNMRQTVTELESTLADLKKKPRENAQAIEMYEPILAGQKAALAEYEDPTPNKTKWERNYPADPAVLVRRKLEDYLKLLKTVDFNAKLTAPDNYGIRKFANPEYESKSAQWKSCYRAGKEVNDVVKAFVEEWLKGDIISASKTRMDPDKPAASQASATPAATAGTSQPAVAPETEAQETSAADSLVTATKAKKSLFSKVKSAAKKVIKD